MNRWLAVTFSAVFLLTCGGVYAGLLTCLLGRFVYGSLWQPIRGIVPKLRIRLGSIFALFLMIQMTIALTHLIWPVLKETSCLLINVPQHVETRIALLVAPHSAAGDPGAVELMDQVTSSALMCGVAIFAWLLGNRLIQSNHLERTFDRLVLRLLVVPLGTLSTVIPPTIVGTFCFSIGILGGAAPRIDSLLWHGVVLLGGSFLGVVYCRAIAHWLARRAPLPQTNSATTNSATTHLEVM